MASINNGMKSDTRLEWPNNGDINVIIKDHAFLHEINWANSLVEPINLVVFEIGLPYTVPREVEH